MTEPTRAFRSGLKGELTRWREEGLVTDDVATALTSRYALHDADLDGPGLLPIYVLGAVLVGAGVISLVAWNWEQMPRALKLAVIGAFVIGAHVAGHALRGGGRHPRLGEAVTLLGSLTFGAGIALVAQVFQVSGAWYGIFGGFAVGAFGAALLLDSTPTLVAAAVAGVGIWASGFVDDHLGVLGALVPWATAAPFLAAGWRRRSRAVVGITALGLGIAVVVSAGFEGWALPALALGAALMAAPAFAPERDAPLADVLATTGRLGFVVVAFVLAFVDVAREVRFAQPTDPVDHGPGAVPLALAGLAAAAAIVAAFVRQVGGRRKLHAASIAAIGAVAIAAGVYAREPEATAVAANVVLVALGVLRTFEGLASLERGPFWDGIAVGAALVTARFFELEHMLWLKGLGFIACGATVTWAAVSFERRRREVRRAA